MSSLVNVTGEHKQQSVGHEVTLCFIQLLYLYVCNEGVFNKGD